MNFQKITYSIPWNLFLIALGSIIAGVGLKSIVIPHGMITGGFSGAGILVFYYTKQMDLACKDWQKAASMGSQNGVKAVEIYCSGKENK